MAFVTNGANPERSSTPDDLGRLALFGSLSTEVTERLAVSTTRSRVSAGGTVFLRGTPADCCYAVVTGTVELLTSNPDGHTKVVEIVRPDQTFGEAVMFLRRPFPVDAVAATDVELLRIPAHAVDAVIENDPQAARAMLASLSVRLHSLVRDVEMYTVHPARERLLSYIAHAVRTAGPHVTGQGVRVEFSPSKRTVASRLGMTPETFSRTLRALVSEGVVAIDGSGVRVPDPDRLLALDAGA